MNILDKA